GRQRADAGDGERHAVEDIDGCRADPDQDLIVLGNGLLNVHDLDRIRWSEAGVEGGSHRRSARVRAETSRSAAPGSARSARLCARAGRPPARSPGTWSA